MQHPFTQIVLMILIGLITMGCSDDPVPRDPGDGPPRNANPGFSSGGGDGDSDGDQDAGDQQDADEDDVAQCSLEPRTALDPFVQPCCFTDSDCHQSNAPNSELMRCYSASCVAGGEGLCRFPPDGANECWTRFDCAPGQRCRDAFTGTCEDPQPELEFPGTCVDQ